MVDDLFQQHEKGDIITDEPMNTVVNDIGKLFDDRAKGVFGTRRNKSNTDTRNYTPWFNNNRCFPPFRQPPTSYTACIYG